MYATRRARGPSVVPCAAAEAASSAAVKAGEAPVPSVLPAQSKRILLVRHGESVFNRDGVFQGSLRGVMKGPKLTRLGHQQARSAGQTLQEHFGSLPGIVARISPLRRARQTWRRIQKYLDIPKDRVAAWQELREIDFFEWEGRSMQEISEVYPEEWQAWKTEPWNLQLASGIRPVELLLLRAAGVWARLGMETPDGGTMLVVAHGGLNRAVMMKALGLPDKAFRDIRFPNAGIVELEMGPPAGGCRPVATRWRWLPPPAEQPVGATPDGWHCAEAHRAQYGLLGQ